MAQPKCLEDSCSWHTLAKSWLNPAEERPQPQILAAKLNFHCFLQLNCIQQPVPAVPSVVTTNLSPPFATTRDRKNSELIKKQPVTRLYTGRRPSQRGNAGYSHCFLSNEEKRNNDWLQAEARDIQMRIEAWDFSGLVIIHEDKLPRKAGGCGGFRSSPVVSLKEML